LEVACTPAPPDLPLKSIYLETPVKGAIRIRIKCTAGNLAQLNLDRLTFYLSGDDEVASQLYEMIFAHALGVVACDTNRPVKWWEYLYPQTIRPEGFDSDQALIPFDARAFQGYRLLHEYFACPQRFRFFTLTGLKKCIGKTEGNTLDLTILLDCPPGALESVVDTKQLALFCTPVINLFPRSIETLKLSPDSREHRIVAAEKNALEFETYAVTRVADVDKKTGQSDEFHSIHAILGNDEDGNRCYATRRELHLAPESARRRGRRTNYVGSEVFLSLTDRNRAPFEQPIKNLAIDTLSTNRDLAPSMPKDGLSDFDMVDSVPVRSVKMLYGPTEPKIALAQGEMTWRIISHLDVNALTLTDLNEDTGPQALRELLSIYGTLNGAGPNKQIEAIRHCRVKQVAHILPDSPIGYGYGARIDLTIDESLFARISPYLFGAVLEQFFARHVSQHSFTETVLHSIQRGEIARWKPRMGKRPIA